jgi:membrane-bound lytic murein transglycosylase D
MLAGAKPFRAPKASAGRDFWIRVYTEVNTNEGFLHDERNLGVVYETLKFSAGSSPRDRQRMVDESRRPHISALRRIIARCQLNDARGAVGRYDKRLLALWGPNPSAINLGMRRRIRFQLGQADRFREADALLELGNPHCRTFANQGYRPSSQCAHVESSSMRPRTRRWCRRPVQFMFHGRRYMRVDDAVDERLDPYRSTEAAAQLLAYNYRVLGSWPLALTLQPRRRGHAAWRRNVGTDDYVKINRT